eukprot:m.170450 g.170450  ORF g.170450 m.170450 type:complete len:64 (-) comp13493_c0_seq2:3328-3519(-)
MLHMFLLLFCKGKGFLNPQDFLKGQKEVFPHLNESSGLLAFHRMDKDKDGHITLRDGLSHSSS